MTNFIKPIRAIVIVCVAALIPFAARSQSQEPIVLGGIFSLTGPGAGLGIPERNGAMLAVKEINAAGGINGRQLELLVEDDGSNPDSAIAKANLLIYSKKAKLLLGPSLTASTVAVGSLTAPMSMLQLAYTGLGPAVELERPCVLHLPPTQELNARALLTYVTRAIGVKKVAVFHDSGYGQVVFNAIKPLAGEFGVEIVAAEKFEIGATDASIQAAKVRAAQPQAVIVVATSATPFRNLRQMKIDVPIIAAIGASSYEYVNAMGDAADGIVYAEFVVSEDPLPHQKAFVEGYKKEFHRPPKNQEAFGYDSVMVAATALRKSGPDAAGKALCDAARTTFDGVITKYNFSAPDMNGIALSGFTYSKLVKGQFTRLPFRAAK